MQKRSNHNLQNKKERRSKNGSYLAINQRNKNLKNYHKHQNSFDHTKNPFIEKTSIKLSENNILNISKSLRQPSNINNKSTHHNNIQSSKFYNASMIQYHNAKKSMFLKGQKTFVHSPSQKPSPITNRLKRSSIKMTQPQSLQTFISRLKDLSKKYSINDDQNSTLRKVTNFSKYQQSYKKQSQSSVMLNQSKNLQGYSSRYPSIQKKQFCLDKSTNLLQHKLGRIWDAQIINDNYLAIASTNNTIPIFTIKNRAFTNARKYLSQQLLRQSQTFNFNLKGHRKSITCLHYDKLSSILYSGSADTMIKVWDMQQKINVFTIKSHNCLIRDVVSIQNDNLLSISNKLSIYSLEKRKDIYTFQNNFDLGSKVFNDVMPIYTSRSQMGLIDLNIRVPIKVRLSQPIRYWSKLSRGRIVGIGEFIWIGRISQAFEKVYKLGDIGNIYGVVQLHRNSLAIWGQKYLMVVNLSDDSVHQVESKGKGKLVLAKCGLIEVTEQSVNLYQVQ